jgi:hypothetical protein
MKATTNNHLPIDHIAFDRVTFRWQYQKSHAATFGCIVIAKNLN